MSILLLYLSIFRKHREKATKYLNEDNQYFGGESIPEPLEYYIRVLTSTHFRYLGLVRFKNVKISI
jgi:hypothetical protein